MKTTKILSLLFLFVTLWSCSDDEEVIPLTQPTFTITVSPENSGIYYFENTTPNKGEFYSYWEFELAGVKVADLDGPVEYNYKTDGAKTVTLTMVSSITNMQNFESITVTLPAPDDDRFLFNPENLLTNGYFAEGTGDDFTGWSKNNGADNMTATTTNTLVGFRALEVNNAEDNTGDHWKTQIVSSPANTTVGDDYTVSMWLKGDPGVVRISTNAGLGGEQYGGDYTVTADWTQYTLTFNANSATTTIALDIGSSKANFFIDAVELVAGTSALPLPSNDSALLNGGLEEGTGDDFTNWSQNNGADNITAEEVEVLGGKRGMKINNPEDNSGDHCWKTQIVSDSFSVTNGEVYVASFWIKGDPAVVRFSTNPGSGGNEQYAGDYTSTAAWTKYSWEFTANGDDMTLAMDVGSTKGIFYIDR